MRKIASVLAAALFAVANAEAREPNASTQAWFYNRPGVSLQQFDLDSHACAEFGASMVGARAGAQYGLVGLVMAGALAGGDQASFTDDCMIARGYRRFGVQDTDARAFQARLSAMSDDERAAILSAETPSEGVLTRRPSNNVWIASEAEQSVTPPPIEPTIGQPPRVTWSGPISARGREHATLSPGPSDAVIVASIRSPTGALVAAQFIRVDPDTGLRAPVLQGGEQRVAAFNFLTRTREPTPKSLVTPAGTYALFDLDMLQLCLGTIAFTVAPGEVVDLGTITVIHEPATSTDRLAPTPNREVRIEPGDAEAVATALSAMPELAARAHPAAFFNGVRLQCMNSFPWAIGGVVMPSAPFQHATPASQ